MRTVVDMSNPINKHVVRKAKPTKCSPGGNKYFEACSECGKRAEFIVRRQSRCFEHSGLAVKSNDEE